MERIAEDNVVRDETTIALAQLDTSVQTQVVFDDVVAGPVVEVDVPAVVAAPSVATEPGRPAAVVEQRQVGVFPDPLVHGGDVRQPVTIAAPRVERSVVAGLLDGVEHVASFDDMAAPAAIANVDPG